jgi:hypothetical protein
LAVHPSSIAPRWHLNFSQQGLDSVADEFSLDIPIHAFGPIVSRAKAKGYLDIIEDKDVSCRLTDSGLDYLNSLDTDREIERSLNALFEDAKAFSLAKGESQDVDVKARVLNLFEKHNHLLIEYFNADSGDNLINYIIEAEYKKPEIYKTLQNILYGSIIATILNAKQTKRFNEFENQEFRDCEIYLDSNYFFYLSGLQKDFENSALQLYKLMNNAGFKLKLFNITKQEIIRNFIIRI